LTTTPANHTLATTLSALAKMVPATLSSAAAVNSVTGRNRQTAIGISVPAVWP
jgi:hypothetical protein